MSVKRVRQQGVSLVELMISITIGMVIILGVVGVSISTFGANANQIKTAQLQYELRKVVDDFARDLRRAGYRPLPTGSAAPPAMDVASQVGPTLVGGAVNMSVQYDIDDDATVADERVVFAYRYAVNSTYSTGQVEVKIGNGNWTPLTDAKVIDITEFQVMKGLSSYTYVCAAGTTNAVSGNVYSVRVTGQLVADAAIKRTVVETISPRNLLVTDCP